MRRPQRSDHAHVVAIETARGSLVGRLESSLSDGRNAMLGVLALTGVGLALVGAMSPPTWLSFIHRLSAEMLLAICVTDLVVAFAAATYRQSAFAWLGRVAVTLAVAAAYVLGFTAGPGEAGQEGRAHLASALGTGAAVEPWLALVFHAAAALLVGFLVLVVKGMRVRATDGRRARAAVGLAILAVVALATAPAVVASATMPEVDGVEAVHAPWLARAVSPFEGQGAFPLVMLGLTVAALALMPLIDRGENAAGWRRACAVAVIAGGLLFVILTLRVSLGAPGH